MKVLSADDGTRSYREPLSKIKLLLARCLWRDDSAAAVRGLLELRRDQGVPLGMKIFSIDGNGQNNCVVIAGYDDGIAAWST